MSRSSADRVRELIHARQRGSSSSLFSALRAAGLRATRANDHRLPGAPDLAFWRARLALFVNGCYWHGCVAHYRAPYRNVNRWRSRVAANRRLDARIDRDLEALGWRVLRIWEHDLTPAGLARVVLEVGELLKESA